MLMMLANKSIEPLITVSMAQRVPVSQVTMVPDWVMFAAALGRIVSASYLGRLAERVTSHRRRAAAWWLLCRPPRHGAMLHVGLIETALVRGMGRGTVSATYACILCMESIMSSTLDPDNNLLQPHVPGHDTEALGPGDSSDTGSDTIGAKRHDFDRDTALDNHALETGMAEQGSDTDRAGTGERAAADGDETIELDADVMPDRIEQIPAQDRADRHD